MICIGRLLLPTFNVLEGLHVPGHHVTDGYVWMGVSLPQPSSPLVEDNEVQLDTAEVRGLHALLDQGADALVLAVGSLMRVGDLRVLCVRWHLYSINEIRIIIAMEKI